MNIIVIILLVLGGIIALLLIAGLFMKKQHFVKREIIINAPRQKVFDYVKLLKNQEAFNKHAMADADRKKEFSGIDGTKGYVYSWSGDKSAGEGKKEIKHITEGERIETTISFTKPMKTSADVVMETKSISENQTSVSWSNTGKLNYPLSILIPMLERSVARDMDSSLKTLKDILEK